MRVIYKPTGQLGEIPDDKFDPKLFQQVSAPSTPTQSKSLSQSVGEGATSLFKGVLGSILNPAIGLINKGLSEQQKAVSATKKGDILGAIVNAAKATKNTFISPESGKAAAETASLAVPFGKAKEGASIGMRALSKYLAPGAAVGGLQGLSEENATPESVVGNTVLGAGGAGILGSLLKAGKVSTDLTKKALSKTGLALEGQATKSVLKASPSAYKNAVEEHGLDLNKIFDKHFKGKTDYDEILGGVKDRGSGGLLGSKIGNAEKVIDKEINAAGSTIRFSADEFTQALRKEAALLKKTVGNEEKVAQINQLIKDTEKRFSKGASSRQVLDLKRAGDSKYGKAVIDTEKGNVTAVTQKILANTARTLLKSRFKKIANALDEETELYTLKPILNSARAGGETGGKSPLGILDLLTAGAGGAAGGPVGALAGFGLKKAVDSPKIVGGLGGILNKASEALPQSKAELNPLLTQILGQLSARSQGVLPISPSADGPDGDNNKYNYPQENLHDTSISQPVNPQADQAQIVKQALAIAMLQDLANGGKNITELKAISEVIDKLGPQSGKPLPVAAQTQVNLAKSGSRGLEEAKKIYSEDPNVLAKQLVPGQWISRRFDSAMFRTVEALLRARSGAAVPEQEVRRYLDKYGPRFGDSKEVVEFKFQQLEQDFNDVLQGAGNTAGSLEGLQTQLNQ